MEIAQMSEKNKTPWILYPVRPMDPVHLLPGITTVGRKPSCNIVVDETHYPSRSHCQFEVDTKDFNKIRIRDLNSTNGVFINGDKCEGVVKLKAGDRVGIGCDGKDDKVIEEKMPVFVLATVDQPNPFKEPEVPVIDLSSDEDDNNPAPAEQTAPSAPPKRTEARAKTLECEIVEAEKTKQAQYSKDDKTDKTKAESPKDKDSPKEVAKEKDATSGKTDTKDDDEAFEISDDENYELELSQCLWRDIKQEFVDLDVESFEESIKEETTELEKKSVDLDVPTSPLFSIEPDADENEDESLSIWVNKLSQSFCSEKSPQKPKQQKRSSVEIIQPPSLPTKKGKLRGVSAVVPSKPPITDDEKISSVVAKIKAKEKRDSFEKDLRRKWLEKPSFTRRKEKEKKKEIIDERKQKLKELADKQAQKRSLVEDEIRIVKKPKVKVTEKNRGAFLTETVSPSTRKSERLSDTKGRDTENKKIEKSHRDSRDECVKDKTKKSEDGRQSGSSAVQKRSTSIDERKETRIQDRENLKPQNKFDHLKSKPKLSKELEVQKRSNGLQDIKTSKTIATRASNESCEQSPAPHVFKIPLNAKSTTENAVKTPELPDDLKTVVNVIETVKDNRRKSILKSPCSRPKRNRRSVTFNDHVKIEEFQIESSNKIMRKVDSKDAPIDFTRFIQKCAENDRKRRLILEDHSEEIIFDILKWDPKWVNQSNNTLIHDLIPMMSNFQNLSDFQRAIFPLMKLELWATIERELMQGDKLQSSNITVTTSAIEETPFGKRLIVYCEVPANDKQKKTPNFTNGDLCTFKYESQSECIELFAFVKTTRRSVSHNRQVLNIAFEVQNCPEYVKLFEAGRMIIARIITQIRVELGAFNAVYNLKLSRLCHKVLSPFQNQNKVEGTIANLRYKGYDPLNENQQNILMKIYRRSIDESNPSISLIEGPPGTGKSRVIVNLILQILYGEETTILSKKILVCAQSNAAIDIIASKLLAIRGRMTRDKFNLVRFGILERISPEVQCISLQKLIAKDHAAKQSSDNHMLVEERKIIETKIASLKSCKQGSNGATQDEIQKLMNRRGLIDNLLNKQLPPELERSSYQRYLHGAHIVCTTLSSCIKLLQYVKYFDVCIIDEATQCLEPWTLIPLQFNVKSLVLVGDTQQLPGTLLSPITAKYGFDVSLFTRIQKCLETTKNNDISVLRTQYRMHPEICRWPNNYFYKDFLVNDPSTNELKCGVKPYAILSLKYDQNHEDTSRGKIVNANEAKFIVSLIKSMSKILPTDKYSYGIITPYAEHRGVLSKDMENSGISNVLVNTIDSYQGKEKDVIIISNARTRGVGFLANSQRLNVALTRARKCLILCGNFSALEHINVWKSLLDNSRRRGFYHEIKKSDVADFDNRVMCHIKQES